MLAPRWAHWLLLRRLFSPDPDAVSTSRETGHCDSDLRMDTCRIRELGERKMVSIHGDSKSKSPEGVGCVA